MRKDIYKIKIFEVDEIFNEIITYTFEETPEFITGFITCMEIGDRYCEIYNNDLYISPSNYRIEYINYVINENEKIDDFEQRVYENHNDNTNKYHIYTHLLESISHCEINVDSIEFILGFIAATKLIGNLDSIVICQKKKDIDINKLLSKYT